MKRCKRDCKYAAVPDSASLKITGDLPVMNGWFRVVGTGKNAVSYFIDQNVNVPVKKIIWTPFGSRSKTGRTLKRKSK